MVIKGKLFIRMFVAFWLLTLAILGSWLLTTQYFDSRPPDGESYSQRQGVPPHRFVLRAIYNLENLDREQLDGAIKAIQQQHNVQVYLVARDGTDLIGRQVPKDVARIASRLPDGRRRVISGSPEGRLVAHLIYRPDSGAISAVFLFPKRRGVILNTLGGNPWLRIALAVLISGVVCFGLSKLMTNRLRDLQVASRRLANGNLDARLQVRDKGGDETDELARDFNSMAEQLQARNQAQKRLLGDVSHELRSPLSRLRIALALAQEKPDLRQEYLRRIERETERLEDLIGQLLASQSRNIQLNTHIDLVSLLHQLCTDANFEGRERGKQFNFSSDTDEATIESSGDLLRKSLENILRNALHYTRDNSSVRVSLESTRGQYQIHVEDEGPGVPEHDLDKIFEEFYRSDSARARESGGYGLGLAIARRSLVQHGGDVVAYNTGTGLKITVFLPIPSGL